MHKPSLFSLYWFALLALTLTSCDAILGIFEAGMWTGILLVFLGVGLFIWLISRLFGRK